MSTYKCSQCGSGDIVTAFTAHVPLKVGDDANEDVGADYILKDGTWDEPMCGRCFTHNIIDTENYIDGSGWHVQHYNRHSAR